MKKNPQQLPNFHKKRLPEAFISDFTSDPDERREDPRHPRFHPLITPNHVVYLKGSNNLVVHRYKRMMEEEGIILDEINDFVEPDGTTLNIEEEVKFRKAHKTTDRIERHVKGKVCFNTFCLIVSNLKGEE